MTKGWQWFVYVIALMIVIGSACMVSDLKTGASFEFLVLFGLVLIVYVLLSKKYQDIARWVFNVWFFGVVFWMFFIVASLIAHTVVPSCRMDSYGEYRCVMPTLQLLVGFLVSIVMTPLSFCYYKKHRNPKTEIIWQTAMVLGLMIGIGIDFLYHFYDV